MRYKEYAFLLVTWVVWVNHAENRTIIETGPTAGIDTIITAFMHRHKIPGMAVVLYTNDQPYCWHCGYADARNKKPVTEKTLFEIGSISKIFTCLLIAQEVLQGTMQLHDPIATHIPQLSRNKRLKSVTLERLGTHTSSLPWNAPGTVRSERALLQHVARWKPTQSRSLHWHYSNHGIELLRIALEESSGQEINSLLLNRILIPLNMSPVGIKIPPEYQQHYARCYNKEGKPAIAWRHPFLLGSAALKVSSIDMLNFLKAALGLPGTPPAILAAMRMTQTPYVAMGTVKHGLGWVIRPLTARKAPIAKSAKKIQVNQRVFNGNALFDKNGTTEGFHAYLAVIPSKKTGVVIMINRRLPSGLRLITNLGKEILAVVDAL